MSRVYVFEYRSRIGRFVYWLFCRWFGRKPALVLRCWEKDYFTSSLERERPH